ncbi:low-density lipoprotein receptor-related protein 1 [Hyalella azteca]|uniref:Low-density lipoprotein receptor-related protein 1 n=1 Tax=Hyalella azteca TaxID=294128 RepID=A0A979FTC9_HYAAZ|nr:low-density lipoprotein receptor-related protein 1 [Hyalella azteca]
MPAWQSARRETCSSDAFKCATSGECIPQAWVCDGQPDCGRDDLSDEHRDTCATNNTCPANTYHCDDLLACVPLSSVCNSHPDCQDGSDEGSFCDLKPCSAMHCHHNCTSTPSGGQCYCPYGQKPVGDACEAMNMCEVEGTCDQLCSVHDAHHRCSCVPGYTLLEGRRCAAVNEPEGAPALLLYGSATALEELYLNGSGVFGHSLSKRVAVSTLDYVYSNRTVCWVNPGLDLAVMECAHLDNLERHWKLGHPPHYQLDYAKQIAVEWVTGNWYVLDRREFIFVCTSSLSTCVTIVDSFVNKPQSIAVDPAQGFLFFSGYGTLPPKIERTFLDGSNRTEIVTKKLVYPSGITLDYAKKQLYWVDFYLGHLARVDYDGEHRKTITTFMKDDRPHWLTMFERTLYVLSEQNNGGLKSVDLDGHRRPVPMKTDLESSNVITVVHRQRQPHVDHPCGVNNGGCDELCVVMYRGSGEAYASCLCQPGHVLHAGVCVEQIPEEFLLYVMERPGFIKGVPLDETHGKQVILPITGLVRPSAVDFNSRTGFIFYSDVQRQRIDRRKVDGSMHVPVVSDGLINVEGLAVDWLAENLYWTDEGRSCIFVCKLDDSSKRRLLVHENLTNPRAIALNPDAGLMYWTVWKLNSDAKQEAKIEVAWMTGEHRSVLVRDGLVWPNGLSLDLERQQLYWCDGYTNTIERIDLSGSGRQVVLHKPDAHFYGLSYHRNHIYWTDFQKGSVHRMSTSEDTIKAVAEIVKLGGDTGGGGGGGSGGSFQPNPTNAVNILLKQAKNRASKSHVTMTTKSEVSDNQKAWLNEELSRRYRELVMTLQEEHPSLFDVKVYSADLQQGTSKCSELNCLHLCLTSPEGQRCACNTGYEPSPHFPQMCVEIANFSMPSHCDKEQFECVRDLRCIDRRFLCDGDNDCSDHSDEDASSGGVCEVAECSGGQFECSNNRCIEHHWVCDGDDDCGDGSDETSDQCTCNDMEFRCGDGHCIPVHWRCDGYEDCAASPGHKSDEDNCEERDCSSGDYRCGNGRCILMAFVCDGNDDCHDNTDEMFCHTICHNVSALNVPNTPPMCATSCNTSLTREDCEERQDCTWCGDSVCFASHQLCDGVHDCPDDADEAACAITLSSLCSTEEFLCEEELRCIPRDFLCDGNADCFDNSDERNCSTISCSSEEWRCTSGRQCILQSYHCNGSPDCDDESDERNCTTSSSSAATHVETPGNHSGLYNPCLAPAVMSCDNGTICLLPHQLCDGVQLCDDGFDEGGRCGLKECTLLACTEGCVQTPYGPLCTCPVHTSLLEDGVTCSSPPHICDVWGTCHQLCHRVSGGGHKCGCSAGFLLEADGFTCKSVERREPYLVFCNRHELHRLSITSNVSSVQHKPLLKGLKNAVALDFWHTDEGIDHLFWTDVSSDQIFTGTLYAGSLTNIHVVLSFGVATAEGLAVDWMGHNLYWVVRGKRSSLQVAQLSGSSLSGVNTKTLIDTAIHSPRAIALDPRDGLIFWTDWEMHKSRIERATMSGGDRRVVVTIGGLGWPNGLTLDYFARRIYWIDAKSDSIHTAEYDGSDPRMILHAHDLLSHPFAITLYGTQVFWTDWRTNSLMSANKYNGSNVSVLRRTITQPFDVVLVHPSRQPREGANACAGNGGCSHLCLLSGPGTRECHCPQEMSLVPNSTQCARKETIIFLSLPGELRGLDISSPSSAFIHHLGNPNTAGTSNWQPGRDTVSVFEIGQLDFDSSEQWVYWTEPWVHEVRRMRLDGSRHAEVLLDTELTNPRGLTIDWVSGNLFFGHSVYNLDPSSAIFPVKVKNRVEIRGSGHISVCKLDGSFRRVLKTVSVTYVPSLAVDPFLGLVYFIDIEQRDDKRVFKIGAFDMTGKAFAITDSTVSSDVVHPAYLIVDCPSQRLYWIDLSTGFVMFYEQKQKTVGSLRRVVPEDNSRIFGLSLFSGYLYYGVNSTLYRSSLSSNNDAEEITTDAARATSVMIYHQRKGGSNSCDGNSCAHLCLPTPLGAPECVCAEGYTRDARDPTICVAADHVLVYASQKGLTGFILQPEGHFEAGGLPVISRLGAVDVVSADVRRNILVVADFDAGTVTQMWRDGTSLKTLVSGASVSGLAVDWIAGNVYWSGVNSISVGRLNDTRQYVLLHDLVQPKNLALHPTKGKLFWCESGAEGGIYTSLLDGTGRRRIVHHTSRVGGVTVDLVHHKLFWSDFVDRRIRGSKLDGSGVFTVIDNLSGTPTALALHDLNLYIVMVGQNVYWSGGNSISVGRLNDTRQYVLLHDLVQPKNLALHPTKGKLFWCESGAEGGIYTSLLDGTGRRRIVHHTSRVGGVTVDLVHHKLFWSDFVDRRIRGSKLDGSGVFTVIDNLSGTPTALALHDLNLYIVMVGGVRYNSSVGFVSVAPSAGQATTLTRVFHTDLDIVSSLSVLSESLGADEYNDCAESNGGCQDLCLYDGSELQCRCFHAALASDKRSCYGHTSYMVYADDKKLSSVHLYDDDDVNPPLRELQDFTARALSVDYPQSRLYYSGVSSGTIRSSFFNGTDDRLFISKQGAIGGLAVEPNERRLYWTCETAAAVKMAALDEPYGASGKHFKAGALDGPRVIHRVVQLNPKEDRPSSIALDFCHRNVYWTNWHLMQPSIQRAGYDGTGLAMVIDTDIVLPNTLAIDDSDGKLYWADARLNKIERCNLDGSHRTIHCADACPVGHSCSDTCTLSPVTREPVCSCHPGRVRSDQSVSGRVRSDQSVLECRDCALTEVNCGTAYCIPYQDACNGVAQCPDASDEDPYYCSTRECRDGFFSCGSGRCIAKSRVCDQQPDCPDMRDESDCPCDTDTGHFLCPHIGICLPPQLRCNAQPDCPDVSDEIGCPAVNCFMNEIPLAAGQSVAVIFVGVHTADTAAGQSVAVIFVGAHTAATAAELQKTPECLPGYHKCHTGLCIEPMFVCDFEDDCADGGAFGPSSDEASCTRTCQQDEFQCGDGSCIMRFWQCDGSAECPDGSDETNCTTLRACNEGWVRCNVTMRCIPPNWICDGDDDCGGSHPPEDEDHDCARGGGDSVWMDLVGASKVDEDHIRGRVVPISCSPGQFACPFFSRTQYLCVAMQFFCDGEVHCLDGSDEPSHCTVHTCPEWRHFRCRNNNCIPDEQVCNTVNDCGDYSDEEDCHEEAKESVAVSRQRRLMHYVVIVHEEIITLVCRLAVYFFVTCVMMSPRMGKNCRTIHCCALICFLHLLLKVIVTAVAATSVQTETSISSGTTQSIASKDASCPLNNFKCSIRSYQSSVTANPNSVQDPEAPVLPGSAGDQHNAKTHNGYLGSRPIRSTSDKPDKTEPVCIDETRVCNNVSDCADNSDEELCGINECLATDPSPCAQICRDLKVGYQCLCYPGYRQNPTDPRLCVDIDECEETHPCPQLCRNQLGSYTCSCAAGYIAEQDGHVCRANSSVQAHLLLSNRYHIREVDIHGHYDRIVVSNLTNAVGLDFDWAENCIYWSDVANLSSSIRRKCGQAETEVIQSSVQSPDGIALDWVARNLYWCDKGQDTIEVSKLNGSFRKVLISKGLSEPRAIVLDPYRGNLYWSDWGEKPHIGKAGMDGSNPRVLFNGTLGWPNALTIDYPSHTLFWADANKDYIAMADLDATNFKYILSKRSTQAFIQHVFALTVFEDWIYWTDWKEKSVLKAHKFTGANITKVYRAINRPMDIHVFHPLRQMPLPGPNPCANNGGCSTLCLLAPGGKAVCECPTNFKLAADNKSCESDCPAHFVCEKSYRCIPFWWKCDTQDDCGDGSDEPDDCPAFRCELGQLQCGGGNSSNSISKNSSNSSKNSSSGSKNSSGNNTCLHPAQICDGSQQCEDGSDERDCDVYMCLSNQFKCPASAISKGLCIEKSKLCDGRSDCPGGEDESDCHPKPCPDDKFACVNNALCIPTVWMCDGQKDCADGSDEPLDCFNRTCPQDLFKCNSSGQCLPKRWVCDGEDDCKDKEDEQQDCHLSLPCGPNEFRCANNVCIPADFRCDGVDDCTDGSDENAMCRSSSKQCDLEEFSCASQDQCVAQDLVCNGVNDCTDGSDEQLCHDHVACKSDYVRCNATGDCILSEWLCDRDVDCPDGSDEQNCSCQGSLERCGDSVCLPASWFCDGEKDCSNGTDEDPVFCAKRECPESRFRCNNSICIQDFKKCDGEPHCSDGSDEDPALCAGIHDNHAWCGDGKFRCSNSHCISHNLVCDSFNDCFDNSDEQDCDTSACSFGTCSQICIPKKKSNATCYCDSNYQLFTSDKKRQSCVAKGGLPFLLVAEDSRLLRLGIYQQPNSVGSQDSHEFSHGEDSPRGRVESVDVFYHSSVSQHPVAYWSSLTTNSLHYTIMPESDATAAPPAERQKDSPSATTERQSSFISHISKLIRLASSSSRVDQRPGTNVSDNNTNDAFTNAPSGGADWPKKRIHRDALEESTGVLVPDLNEPRGVAVDWVGGWVYVGCKDSIVAVSADGNTVVTVLKARNLQPQDLVLDPSYGRMYWTSVTNLFSRRSSGIETSLMDGRERNWLLTRESHWPTGLAIDYPAKRLYWTDLKLRAIFTTKLDGSDKHLVKTLAVGYDHPNKLSVFEDFVYVSMSRGHRVYRVHKFGGRSHNLTLLAQYPLKVTHITIVQENKQNRNITNPCSYNPCPVGQACFLAGPGQHSCLCPRRSNSTECGGKGLCGGPCGNGTCVSSGGVHTCQCWPGYYGKFCQSFKCSDICQQGVCTQSATSNATCVCDGGWTGPRCDVDMCIGGKCTSGGKSDHECKPACRNNGWCVLASGSGKAFCRCPPGFSGSTCENDACYPNNESFCGLKGSCSLNATGSAVCSCPAGYTGDRCQHSNCDAYCIKGNCNLQLDGRPACSCFWGYIGDRCERNVSFATVSDCNGVHCENGGTCHRTHTGGECQCPVGYAGDRCEERSGSGENLCAGIFCKHGGWCKVEFGNGKCRCPDEWVGEDCSVRRSCRSRCFNGGTCIMNPDPSLAPECLCPIGFYGLRCETSSQSLDKVFMTKWRESHYTAAVVSTIITLLLLLSVLLLGVWWKCRRSRRGIEHVRLEDTSAAGTVELTNPIFMAQGAHHDDEPVFTLQDAKQNGNGTAGNFKNPVYDSLYERNDDTVAALEERAGLLDSVDPLGVMHQSHHHENGARLA